MNILLDTHVLIWLAIEPQKLSRQATHIIMNSNNTLSFSLVSIWEMQIKIQLNKLRINLPLSEVIDRQQQVNGLQILPIELTHIFALEQLPNPHRDPV